jgi:hypothetical protein
MVYSKEALQIAKKHMKKQEASKERVLDIFFQLSKIPQFQQWMSDHITIRDEVDDVKKQITTYVIFKDQAIPETPEETNAPDAAQ